MNKKAFTLLELIIVILIIAIIATVAIPQYTNFVEKSRAAEAINILGSIKNAELTYRLETGTFTSNLNNLYIDVQDTRLWRFRILSDDGQEKTLCVRATRTNNDAPPGIGGTFIEFTWNDSEGMLWTGDHPGTPSIDYGSI